MNGFVIPIDSMFASNRTSIAALAMIWNLLGDQVEDPNAPIDCSANSCRSIASCILIAFDVLRRAAPIRTRGLLATTIWSNRSSSASVQLLQLFCGNSYLGLCPGKWLAV